MDQVTGRATRTGAQGICFGPKVLTGQGAAIDTTTASGKLVFGIFAALAELARELISERTTAGSASAQARGRKGGRPYRMTPAKVRLAQASMGQPGTKVAELCQEFGVNDPGEQLRSHRPASFTGVDAATKQSRKTATERPHPQAGAVRGSCDMTAHNEV